MPVHEVGHLSLACTAVVVCASFTPCGIFSVFCQPAAVQLQVYAPSRTVGVYGPSEWGDPEADQHTWGVPGLGIKDRGPHFGY